MSTPAFLVTLRRWWLWEAKYEIKRRWQQRYVWRVLKLIPEELQYWIIVRWAVKDEPGNPGNVTALTMMKRIRPNE